MGEEQDTWLEEEGNLERWTTGPKEGGLHAWEKNVQVTQWAGRAWEKLCCGTETSPPYNFEASARSLGMLMTIDGSALELMTHNYGRDEWWLLLRDPVSP